jgi:2-keto-myo-inositol isomerase
MLPLCLNTSTIRPRSLQEKIEAAARAGFDLVELWCEDVEAHLRAGGTVNQVRRWLRDAGLEVPSMIALTGWADADEATFARRLAGDLRDRLELAAALGCPRIVASPPMRPGADLATVGTRYAALLALGRRVGVRPAMEFLGFAPEVNRIPVCLEVMARANDPDACLVIDPFHIFRGGGRFEDVRLVPGHAIAICHVDDAPTDRPREDQHDRDRVLPGDGGLPLVDLVRSLRAVGYHGPLSLELFHEGLWAQDPVAVATEGRRRLERLLQAAGEAR